MGPWTESLVDLHCVRFQHAGRRDTPCHHLVHMCGALTDLTAGHQWQIDLRSEECGTDGLHELANELYQQRFVETDFRPDISLGMKHATSFLQHQFKLEMPDGHHTLEWRCNYVFAEDVGEFWDRLGWAYVRQIIEEHKLVKQALQGGEMQWHSRN